MGGRYSGISRRSQAKYAIPSSTIMKSHVMSEDWKTKYGSRRVRHDPPTLEEAIFAAQGITDDLQGQIEISASLMGMAPEAIRDVVVKSRPSATQSTRMISTERGVQRAVVVERRVIRRPLTERRPLTQDSKFSPR
jgi:hypothetical protein